jgi:prepilin-type processing-associated H-X9-DG protein
MTAAAFTLVELLIVVGIIAMLATLLFPALVSAKRASHSAVCMGNERQINMKLRIKLDDVNQRLDDPEYFLGFWNEVGTSGWICPAAPAVNPLGRNPAEVAWRWGLGSLTIGRPHHIVFVINNRAGSYATSQYMIDASLRANDTNDTPEQPITGSFRAESEIMQPELTPVLADSTDWWTAPHASDPAPTDLTGAGAVGGMSALAIPRHGSRPAQWPKNWPQNQPLPGAVNVSFFDGHSESVKLDRLWQLYWHLNYVPPVKRPGLP